MSFQLGLSNCQPRSAKDHALGPRVEPHGVHCRKGLACVTFPCQLCDSATHFHSDIFRVKLCVAESLFHAWWCCPSVESSSCVLESGRRRYAVGENWEPAWMVGTWGSCSAPGIHSPAPLFKREAASWTVIHRPLQQQGTNQIENTHQVESSSLLESGSNLSEIWYLLTESLHKFPSQLNEEFSLLHGL